jgi:hypothetical protein
LSQNQLRPKNLKKVSVISGHFKVFLPLLYL